jgi:hypothetical protein
MRLFGQPKTYNFDVEARPFDESAPPQPTAGRLIQRPPLPPWMLITSAVLAILATLFFCIGLAFRQRDQIADLWRGMFAIPSPTALAPTVDAPATAQAIVAASEQTQQAIAAELQQSAEAAGQSNQATQDAVAQASEETMTALETQAAATQTAAASSAAATGTVQALQVEATQTAGTEQSGATATAFAGNAAATATAQANATGTAFAGTQTAQAQTASVPAATATATPATGATALPGETEVITFDRIRTLAVNNRLPIRGDEYAGQNAFFCFYRPVAEGSVPPDSALGQPVRVSLLALPPRLPAQQPSGVSIDDVALNEGSSGGTTTFSFVITWIEPEVSSQSRTLQINFATADGPSGSGGATSPGDYLPAFGTAVLSIPAGQNVATARVDVAVVADTLFEPPETFTVNLSNPSSPVTIVRAVGLGTILNDDVLPTETPTNTTIPTETPDVSDPVLPPADEIFDCQPPEPSGTDLVLRGAVIYPPPVEAANSSPLHSLTTDNGEDQLDPRTVAVVNFQRNVVEANVDLWYPGGLPATYVMFAFDERGELINTSRRDAIGVPSIYQLNVRSLERPIRQLVIEARAEFDGEFRTDYSFDPIVPPLLTRVELRVSRP